MEWILTGCGPARGSVDIDGAVRQISPEKSYTEETALPCSLVIRSKEGKLADSEDSFLFCGIKIDPGAENFEFSALFSVSEVSKSPGWNSGYGIVCLDMLGTSGKLSRHRNMLAAGRFRAQKSDRLEGGLRAVAGHTSPGASEYRPGRRLDASRTFGGAAFPDRLEAGESYRFVLRKTDSGFEGEVADKNGSRMQTLPGCDFLLKQEASSLYAGFFAAGSFTLTVKDIVVTLTPGGISHTPEAAIKNCPPDYPYPRDLFGGRELPVSLKDRPAGSAREDLSEEGRRAPRRLAAKKKVTLFVSPEGTPDGSGTESDPLDLQTAVDRAEPGKTLCLADGLYRLARSVIASLALGPKEGEIRILAEHAGEAVLDGSDLSDRMPAMIISGSGWHVEGLVFQKAPGPGVLVSGSRNRLIKCTARENGDTGILICGRTWEDRADLPSDNEIRFCTSHDNCDPARGNADGFGAKLAVGEGNRFYECIAHHNIDDGFDLYTKSTLGPIGAVKIEKCVAYRNGRLSGDDKAPPNGRRGMGFKLGGEYQAAPHVIRHSVAYANDLGGFSINTNHLVIMRHLTAWDNGAVPDSRNYSFYSEMDFKTARKKTRGLLPPLLKGQTQENNRWRFRSTDTSIEPQRRRDGTIDMRGLLETTVSGRVLAVRTGKKIVVMSVGAKL